MERGVKKRVRNSGSGRPCKYTKLKAMTAWLVCSVFADATCYIKNIICFPYFCQKMYLMIGKT